MFLHFVKGLINAWKSFAHILGRIQTVILLTLFYFFVLGPTALIFRLLGKFPLPYRAKAGDTYWLTKPTNTRGEIQYFQQY